MTQRYDVVYYADYVTVEPHFCRDWDETGGCYGTNPDHGYSIEEACEMVSDWYKQEADLWRSGLHWRLSYYKEDK
jgi:hypothetical protein